MKRSDLYRIYPLVTWSMMGWHFFTALILIVGALVFTKMEHGLELQAYFITIGALVVLASIPIFGFIRQFQARNWVHKHAVAYGNGVLYLADRVQNLDELRLEYARVCDRDVLGEVIQRLKIIKGLPALRKPDKVVLVIAQTAVVKEHKLTGKKWKVMGLQLGRRAYLTWSAAHVDAFRGLLGHELGHVVLDASGFRGAHELVIQEARLSAVFKNDAPALRVDLLHVVPDRPKVRHT